MPRVFDPGQCQIHVCSSEPSTAVGLGCSSKILLTKAGTDPLPSVPQPPGPCTSHQLNPLLPRAAFLPLPSDGAGEDQGQAAWAALGEGFHIAELSPGLCNRPSALCVYSDVFMLLCS